MRDSSRAATAPAASGAAAAANSHSSGQFFAISRPPINGPRLAVEQDERVLRRVAAITTQVDRRSRGIVAELCAEDEDTRPE